MPLSDQTQDFTLSRYVNLSNSAEGPQLPPKLIGNIRIPTVSGFGIASTSVNDNGTNYVLRWTDISQSRVANVDHYSIFVSGLSTNKDPIQLASSTGSPCTVNVPGGNTNSILTFYCQTVLKSGMHSELSDSPTCTSGIAPLTGSNPPGSFTIWPFTNAPTVTPPTAGWTAENATATDTTYGYPYLSTANRGGPQVSLMYRTAPAPPYTLTGLIMHDVSGTASGTRGSTPSGAGLAFRDSSGKIVIFSTFSDNNGNGVWVAKFTNATTLSAIYQFVTGAANAPDIYFRTPMWLRIKDDGANLTFWWSIDGNHWLQYFTVSRTDFFASGPTEIALAAYPQSASCEVCAISWAIT